MLSDGISYELDIVVIGYFQQTATLPKAKQQHNDPS